MGIFVAGADSSMGPAIRELGGATCESTLDFSQLRMRLSIRVWGPRHSGMSFPFVTGLPASRE